MKNSAWRRSKNSWFNKALIKGDSFLHAGADAAFDAALTYGLGGRYSDVGNTFRRSYKNRRKVWKKWQKGMKGQITGSARGPVYGSNPHPPIYGSPPIGDPVKYKLAFLTPEVTPIEKWHKGKLC